MAPANQPATPPNNPLAGGAAPIGNAPILSPPAPPGRVGPPAPPGIAAPPSTVIQTVVQTVLPPATAPPAFTAPPASTVLVSVTVPVTSQAQAAPISAPTGLPIAQLAPPQTIFISGSIKTSQVSSALQTPLIPAKSSALTPALSTPLLAPTPPAAPIPPITPFAPLPPTQNEPQGISNSLKLGLGIGIPLAVLTIVSVAGFFFALCRYRKRSGRYSPDSEEARQLRRLDSSRSAMPPTYVRDVETAGEWVWVDRSQPMQDTNYLTANLAASLAARGTDEVSPIMTVPPQSLLRGQSLLRSQPLIAELPDQPIYPPIRAPFHNDEKHARWSWESIARSDHLSIGPIRQASSVRYVLARRSNDGRIQIVNDRSRFRS